MADNSMALLDTLRKAGAGGNVDVLREAYLARGGPGRVDGGAVASGVALSGERRVLGLGLNELGLDPRL